MIELWGINSTNVQKILIALNEMEFPFKFKTADILHYETTQPIFGELTENRKVPVIVDSDGIDGEPITVWESGAILFYLAEKSGQFFPAEGKARYHTMQWLMFQMAGIGPMFGQQTHFNAYAKDQPYSISRYGTEVKRLYDVCERRLAKSRFLGGDDYSIADMAAYPWIRQFQQRGVERDDVPSVSRWEQEVAARPAVQAAMQFASEIKNHNVADLLRDQADDMDRLFGRGRYARA